MYDKKKCLISLIECVYAFWGNIYINVPTVEILAFSATLCLQMDYAKTVRLSKHVLITSGFTFFLTFFTLFHKKGFTIHKELHCKFIQWI